jgi:hypothetical protein
MLVTSISRGNKMVKKLVGVCSLMGLLTACSTTVNMYPIEGPLSRVQPLPVIIANVDGIASNTGSFKFVTPNAVSCSGRWSSVAPQAVSSTYGTLFTQYGSVAGFATTVSNLPGVNKGQAFGTCSNNDTFDVEFLTGSGTANGYGIARDSAGNVYKLIF